MRWTKDAQAYRELFYHRPHQRWFRAGVKRIPWLPETAAYIFIDEAAVRVIAADHRCVEPHRSGAREYIRLMTPFYGSTGSTVGNGKFIRAERLSLADPLSDEQGREGPDSPACRRIGVVGIKGLITKTIDLRQFDIRQTSLKGLMLIHLVKNEPEYPWRCRRALDKGSQRFVDECAFTFSQMPGCMRKRKEHKRREHKEHISCRRAYLRFMVPEEVDNKQGKERDYKAESRVIGREG